MVKSNKTRKNKGGKIIGSGGYGCVFRPALKCESSNKREHGKITKLMTDKHATQEYEQIRQLKGLLHDIPNYEDYFLLNDVTLCRPAKLTQEDLNSFSKTCKALPKAEITKKNINSKLDEVMSLNLPDGGLPIDDYIYQDGSLQKIYNIHLKLVDLLAKGIVPMNKRGIYHNDIKDSNILISQDGKTRLIDWGLTVEYKPSLKEEFPRNWRNRPLQFNVPFSVIIFSDAFYERYSEYLKKGGKPREDELKPFVIDYLTFWMKERGAGHYKFINEIFYKLYANDLKSVSSGKPKVIETEITVPFIVNYITDVLVHFTKFKEDGSLNLREYLNDVFIKIVDIWGLIMAYYPLLELLHNNYSSLGINEMNIFKKLKEIFNTYLFDPRHEPIEINSLLNDLRELGELIKKSAGKDGLASGNGKTRKMRTLSFKRKRLIKRFKNPILLTSK